MEEVEVDFYSSDGSENQECDETDSPPLANGSFC